MDIQTEDSYSNEYTDEEKMIQNEEHGVLNVNLDNARQNQQKEEDLSKFEEYNDLSQEESEE